MYKYNPNHSIDLILNKTMDSPQNHPIDPSDLIVNKTPQTQSKLTSAIEEFINDPINLKPKATLAHLLTQKFKLLSLDILNNLLYTTGSVIAGSVPMYALNPWGKEFGQGDLDIWISTKNTTAVKAIGSYLGSEGYVHWSDMPSSNYRTAFGHMAHVTNFRSTTLIPFTTVQLIMVNLDTPAKICFDFDLSFCAVYWTGRVFGGSGISDNLVRVGTLNLNAPLTMERRRRIEKYIRRGYSILNVKEYTQKNLII